MIKFRLLILILIFSCGSKKVIINSQKEKIDNQDLTTLSEKKLDSLEKTNISLPVINNVNDYIDYFSQVAMDEMRTYKIPASITLAQGILESGSGKGRLAIQANNHFGIKCGGKWSGFIMTTMKLKSALGNTMTLTCLTGIIRSF